MFAITYLISLKGVSEVKRKFLYLSASLLLFACSNEGAAVDSTVEVEAMDTTEVVEEVVEYNYVQMDLHNKNILI